MSLYKLTHIYIYPIKSFKGIEVNETALTLENVLNDRRWMLVDENNTFISQRTTPVLTLFDVTLQNEQLSIGFKNDEIIIPLTPAKGMETIKVKIWEDEVEAINYDLTVNRWFSDKLKTNVKLVYLPNNNKRKKIYQSETYSTTFTDGFPLLIIGSKSFEKINETIGREIHPVRFRPNLVFETNFPFEEDQWKTLTNNKVKIKIVKPCARCIIPTINPNSGEQEKDVMKTLQNLRLIENKILLGQNALVKSEGIISSNSLWTIN